MIDDCALARLIKGKGRIWLGLTKTSRSIRAYVGLGGIWDMVTRSAFTQLHHSVVLLLATAIGMLVIYMAPPLAGWLMMSVAFGPTLRLFEQPRIMALSLPLAALFYVAMTIDSAALYWRGRGGLWKGRVNAI